MADTDDIEIPSPWDDGDAPEESTVLQLVKECQEQAAKRAIRYLSRGLFNERMIAGEQFIELDNNWQVRPMADWPDYVPQSGRNLLRNLSLTWSSRILEDSPWVACYASEPGLDEMKAQVATTILENVRQQHDIESMQFDASQLVQPHSAVGFKVVWDPLAGPPSPGTQAYDEAGNPVYDEAGEPVLDGVGEPTGDVVIDLVSIFDYATDGAENIEKSKWCYFSTYIDLYDARALLEAAGLPWQDVKEEEYDDPWEGKRCGVKVTELWWRPDTRFPKGLYAVVVADQAIQAIPFPYDHGELPVAVWKCGARRGSPYGTSHVDDAVPIQQNINKTVSALTQQAMQIGAIKLLAPTAIVEMLDQTDAQMLPCDDPAMANSVRYIEPPPRSEVLVQNLEDNTQALYAVYGLNEILSGAENVKSGTSAKSIAYLNRLDAMKSAGASRSLNKAILRMCKQILKLYAQYVKAPRLAAIAGQKSLEAAQMFVGADLMGVDVKMEPVSGKTQMRGQVAGEAKDQMAAGNPDPALRQVSKTGIADTSFARASRDIVRAQADAALRGEPQRADPEVDANLAVEELSAYMMNSRGSPNAPALQALIAEYQQKAQQMMAPPAQGPQT